MWQVNRYLGKSTNRRAIDSSLIMREASAAFVRELDGTMTTEPVTEKSTTTPTKRQRVLWSWSRDLLLALAFSALFIVFLYQPVRVEGTSMLPGLQDQE